MSVITLKSGRLTAEIHTLGAEVRRLTCDGKDLLWSGDPAVWKGVSPVLFPFVGGMKNDGFTYRGLKYKIGRHGFARNKEWQAEQTDETSAVFTLRSDDETLNQYPFACTLRAEYRFTGDTLRCAYTVTNTETDKSMYYMFGGHPAFSTRDGGLQNWKLRFAQAATYSAVRQNKESGLVSYFPFPAFEGDTLALSPDLFDDDALILPDVPCRTVYLQKGDTPRFRIDFDDFQTLGLWTKKGCTDYICIEPWTEIPEPEGQSSVLGEKKNMRTLHAGQSETLAYSITVLA